MTSGDTCAWRDAATRLTAALHLGVTDRDHVLRQSADGSCAAVRRSGGTDARTYGRWPNRQRARRLRVLGACARAHVHDSTGGSPELQRGQPHSRLH